MLNRIRVLKSTVFLLRTISLLSLISLVSGFLLLVFFIATGAEQKRLFNHVEFPLPNVSNAVVDTEDRVWVNNVAYGRVQIYDQSGRFLRGFFSVAPMEPSLIGFDGDGNTVVVTHRGNRTHIFTDDGSLLRQEADGKRISSEWRKEPQWTRDRAGREYVVRDRWLTPQVVRVSAHDQEVFLSTPFYLWPFVAPVPCLISLILTQFVSNRLSRKIRRHDDAKSDLLAIADNEPHSTSGVAT